MKMKLLMGFIAAGALGISCPEPTWSADVSPAADRPPAVTAAYRQRLEFVRQQLPAITTAAEAVARRWVDRRHVLLHYPFGGDASDFSMENIARAGGLENAQPNTMRLKLRTTNDVIVAGTRSWEKGAEFLGIELPKARSNEWMIVVFGSRQGLPANLPVDFLIDNGAATGSESEAALNEIVNLTEGWMWSCEVAAALTRLGWRPGILKGMPLPGSTAHNKEYQRSDALPELYPWKEKPIAAGELGRAYLDQVERQLVDLEGKATRDAIARAADLAVDHVKRGKTLWATSFTHVLDGEVFFDNQAPIKAFRGISCGPHGETFTSNLKPGDLLFFFGEWTLNMPWTDYLKIIRSTGADYIPSWRYCTEPMEPYEGGKVFYDQNVSDAQMVLEQRWPFENAAVAIPFPPGTMAPISGVHVCLLYRMLDDAIARRLAVAGTAP